MAVNPVDGATAGQVNSADDFAEALNSAQNDEELMDQMITQAIVLGGQFIIMPRAQEILKEAQADDEE
ncbi:hypothetical protein [Stutzerimonas stutzeri]|uniref:hypothetical protein n=1 Tax=Stutzerimonas stutzeri TaxID=316 RepID=UPI00210A893F|nr:hypothetical protein [Stutzerimonas stutzeri]MCQ4260215.1 hypothetical protein [Stutzerimonas stutzeri]